jgi:hypothetical protein
MTSFSGRFQYTEETGAASQSGSCRVTLEEENLLLTPEKGPPLALDLGDIDAFSSGDYQLSLKLYNDKTILLDQFGKTFQNLSHDLLEAYRHRLVQCLLLEDLEEIARFDGLAQIESAEGNSSSRAELRLYRSNLAILPEAATGWQWRLADIDAVDFDASTYALRLRSGNDLLFLTKLAKRTHEFIERLQSAMSDLAENSARILHGLFPFLTPDQFRQTAEFMKEGRAAAVSQLRAIDSKIVQALLKKTVDIHLQPYFDFLEKQTGEECLFAGFKWIRPETGKEAMDREPIESKAGEPQVTADAPDPDAEEAESEQEPVLHWFLFPLKTNPDIKAPANLAAWESTSRSGRATYFFRLHSPHQNEHPPGAQEAPGALESAIQRLNRALVLLNFKREPIYLPDDSFEMQPRYRRYAIACRKIPMLKRLRTSYLGRALHTSPEAWEKQVQSILAKA